jgi:(p)ppGpp synthase/HD superfamily hydrolase
MLVQGNIDLTKQLTSGHKDYFGRGYYMHDIEVMRLLPDDATDTEKKAALLHSVLDLSATIEQGLLSLGVEPEVVEIVRLPINGPSVRGYEDYVVKCSSIVVSKISLRT